MPRRHAAKLELDTPLLRHYLVHANPTTGAEILADAFGHGEAGAVELLRLALSTRANPRTARQVAHFRTEWFRRGTKEKWFLDARSRLLALFRSLRKWAQPNQPHTDPRVAGLPRGTVRLVTGGGVAREDRTTLRQRAREQSQRLVQEMQGAQLVLWMDNLYLERFGTTPGGVVLSQNVTAMAVLVVDRQVTGPRGTRSVHWPGFPGHPEVTALVQALPQLVDDLERELPAFIHAVRDTAALDLDRTELRVPLDVQRGRRPRLRWAPYDVNQLQVGSNEDLVRLLHDAVDLQQHSGHSLPLLVDENIHYRVARMLYGSPYKRWGVGGLLRQVPLLYGVWHAYKHTLTVLYRTYFAVLAHLDRTGQPPSRGPVTNRRKVLFMEKVMCVLYLLR
jgi:hypothetical protein